MTHLLAALFFSLLLLALLVLVEGIFRDNARDIVAALRGRPRVRAPRAAPAVFSPGRSLQR